MSLFMIGLILTASLWPFMVLAIMKYVSNCHDVRENGVRVTAKVIDVQVKQDWREEEGWYRDEWSGELKRKKTWQTYYDVTASWAHPQTGCLVTSRTRIWSKDATRPPVEGDCGMVCFAPRTPERSCLDLPSSRNQASSVA